MLPIDEDTPEYLGWFDRADPATKLLVQFHRLGNRVIKLFETYRRLRDIFAGVAAAISDTAQHLEVGLHLLAPYCDDWPPSGTWDRHGDEPGNNPHTWWPVGIDDHGNRLVNEPEREWTVDDALAVAKIISRHDHPLLHVPRVGWSRTEADPLNHEPDGKPPRIIRTVLVDGNQPRRYEISFAGCGYRPFDLITGKATPPLPKVVVLDWQCTCGVYWSSWRTLTKPQTKPQTYGHPDGSEITIRSMLDGLFNRDVQ